MDGLCYRITFLVWKLKKCTPFSIREKPCTRAFVRLYYVYFLDLFNPRPSNSDFVRSSSRICIFSLYDYVREKCISKRVQNMNFQIDPIAIARAHLELIYILYTCLHFTRPVDITNEIFVKKHVLLQTFFGEIQTIQRRRLTVHNYFRTG